MKLRAFDKDDAAVVCSWIRTEEELYRWSADRYNRFPLYPEDIISSYDQQLNTGRFYPMTAVDDAGNVAGHFIIRYPKAEDKSSARFGFVIVAPTLRGKGYGKEMLRQGIRYAKETLKVSRIDLGVFENNPSAKHCYEAVGFRPYSERECALPIGTWKCIDMEIFL